MSSPFIPQVIEQPAPQGRPATAADFGALEGRALQGLGRSLQSVSNVNTQIFTAFADSQDRAALADASNEIANLELDFANDTEFDTREDRFSKGMAAINDRLSKRVNKGVFGVGGSRTSTQFQVMADRARVRQRDQGRVLAINQGRADTRTGANLFMGQAASSLDPDDREFFRGQAIATIDAGQENGFFSAEEAARERRDIDRGISTGQINRLRRDAPIALIGELKDPNAPLTRGLSEAERQTQLTSAVNAYQQDLRDELSREKNAADQEKEARRLAGIAAQTELVTIAAAQPGGVTYQDVQDRAVALADTPEKLEKWFNLALNGGEFANEQTWSRPVYSDLYGRSARGETIVEDVADAFLEGDITKQQHDQLLKSSEDVRIGAARTFLSDALGVNSLGSSDARRAVIGEAAASFDEWAFNHPKASREEARAQAGKLVEAANSNSRTENWPAFNLAPSNSVFEADGTTVDLQATAQAIIAAGLDEFEEAQENRKLLNKKRSQEAKAERNAAKAAATEARQAR